jgi:hypothetical protein
VTTPPIDEISNLDNGTTAGEDLSDHIKYFTSDYL